jgi:HSP20 family protein
MTAIHANPTFARVHAGGLFLVVRTAGDCLGSLRLRPLQSAALGLRFQRPPQLYETDEALTVVMEIPGVEKKDIDVDLENDVLRVEGRIDFSKYEELEPLYTEYNVGHFARAFTLPRKFDPQQITAQVAGGVLTLTLRKAKEAQPRRIAIV